MTTFWQDLRYGARMLLKNPGFTLIAIITIALGFGANTAIFSVVNGVVLRPLPYKEPNRLVRVYSEFPGMNLRKFCASVRELNPARPIFGTQPMSDTVADSLTRPRFLSILRGSFSAIALVLAAVGIYGVMAYSVSQRTQEIGVRMALGARASDVLKMIPGQGTRLAAAGIGIGLVGAFALTRVMSTLLSEVSVTDPLTFAAVVALLAGGEGWPAGGAALRIMFVRRS